MNVQSYTRSSCKHSHLYSLGFFSFWLFLRNIILPSFCIKYKYVTKKDIFFSSQQILNNYVQFEVYSGLSQVASLKMSQSRVSDGEWHHLLVELKSAKDGKDLKYLAVMSLDYGMYQVRQHHEFTMSTAQMLLGETRTEDCGQVLMLFMFYSDLCLINYINLLSFIIRYLTKKS